MEEIELRANAMLQEIVAQRNSAFDRCATLQAEIAFLKNELETLKKKEESLES